MTQNSGTNAVNGVANGLSALNGLANGLNGINGLNAPYGSNAPGVDTPRGGRGDAIRAAGESRLMESNAMINYEEGRSRSLDNQLKALKIRGLVSQMAKQQRNEEASLVRATRDHWLRNRVPDVPARLTSAELNRYDNQIRWPRPLMGEEFKVYRDRLGELYAAGSPDREAIAWQYEVKANVDAMKEVLKEEMMAMPSTQYLSTKKFLESVAWERQFEATAPVQNTATAQR